MATADVTFTLGYYVRKKIVESDCRDCESCGGVIYGDMHQVTVVGLLDGESIGEVCERHFCTACNDVLDGCE